MVHCVAHDCKNRTENTTGSNISFHAIPKDQHRRKTWLSAINRTEIPSTGRLCSEHFSNDCFEGTSDLKSQLCPELFGARSATKRKLKTNAVPTIFNHKETSQVRRVSIERNQRKERSNVSIKLYLYFKRCVSNLMGGK